MNTFETKETSEPEVKQENPKKEDSTIKRYYPSPGAD